MCNDTVDEVETPKTGGYGGVTGKWYLRFTRLAHDGPKETKKVLERAKGPADIMTALEEAKEVYQPIYEASRRQIRPTDPVTDPTLCYETLLYPTI